jgi:inosine triphosphate pyrophosphatase
MNKTITFITGNEGKAREMSQLLEIPLNNIKLDLPEIQSANMAEIIETKTKEAFTQINGPVLVDDVSLDFCAWGSLPGPFIKWFLKGAGTEKICKMLNSFEDRSSIAHCYLGYYDGEKLMIFDGQMKGEISTEPRGENGLGWDPIFIPEHSQKTFAEMSSEEKNADSHRSRAVAKLKAYLSESQA